jgi:hypothetical protein
MVGLNTLATFLMRGLAVRALLWLGMRFMKVNGRNMINMVSGSRLHQMGQRKWVSGKTISSLKSILIEEDLGVL